MCNGKDKTDQPEKKKLLGLDRFIRVMSRGHLVTDRLIETREGKVDDEFGYIDDYIDRVEGYGAKSEATELRQRRTTLGQRVQNVNKLKKNEQKDKELESIKSDARDLATDANRLIWEAKDASEARLLAATSLEGLEAEERAFREPGKDGKNPLIEIVKTYTNQLADADNLTKSTSRTQEYNRLVQIMKDDKDKCWPCKQALRSAQSAVQCLVAKIELLPKQVGFTMPRGAKEAAFIRKSFKDLGDGIGKAYAIETTLDGLKQALTKIISDAPTIAASVDDLSASLADLHTMQNSVTTRLQSAASAIDDLPNGEPKNTLSQELAKLRNDDVQARQIAIEGEQKKAFFKLDREALALIEHAKKAVFDVKSASPQGCQEIDNLIGQLGQTTNDPAQQALCRAALASRFKLKIEVPDGLSVKRLPLLYKLFAEVPPEHVGHDLLTRLEIGTEPASNSSYYWKTYQKIVLEPGIDTDADQDYNRQDGTGAKETLKYFSATTLHEIGHGVDAKFNVMRDHGGSNGCGQWQLEDLGKVVTAYYDSFFKSYVGPNKQPTEADLKSMLRTLLTGGTPIKPADPSDPLGSLLADWDQIAAEPAFKTYCAGIRSVARPWTKKYAAGTRVFLESYVNDWWSYIEAERSNGISDYQWRAPAEWFAEVYALYHLKKVKGYPDSIKKFIEGNS